MFNTQKYYNNAIKISTLFVLTLAINSNILFAQDTTIKIQAAKVLIEGYKKSNIKLVDFANKQIGNMVTYTAFKSKEVIVSFYLTNKQEGVYKAYIQTIYLEDAAGLIPEIEVKKAFNDPELKTNPKKTWDVSIVFKQKNGEYKNIGNTVEYGISYNEKPKMVSEKYEGTQRLIPFETKKAAEEFAAYLKVALKVK